ncbi:MOSC domain-containing protein [Inhella proteolytica]|uniref:MOSC domain-containing protein n=1 Tax=Inhella proteolytica TaxID=2795029 RepID=A0A931IZZ7_9BURK|nr:MOSC domain-containing protein [Inhella proteolytica]MBH9576173.1 MOSC domain-containing protein [Inhella proteolytica]
MQLSSLNLGQPRDLGPTIAMPSGACKLPVAEPVWVDAEGLTGDFIGDRRRHGGADQAVYLFSQTDLDWWAQELQRDDIGPGFFGENLTLSAGWPEPRVGDRLAIGALRLEISFPRIPCATLALRVGDPRFLKAFVAACRPGWYARVLVPAAVQAGMPVVLESRGTGPSCAALFAAWHASPRPADLLRLALQAPIAERGRRAFEHWLQQPVA